MTRRPECRMLPPPSTVATAPNPALIPLTSHVIAGRYGAESPLDPAGGLAGKTAQNRQTPPPIAAGALPRGYPPAATGAGALAACCRRATSASRSAT